MKKGLMIRFCREFFLKYWHMELLVFLLIIADTVFVLLVPYLNKILIDDVLIGKKYQLFYIVLGSMVGINLLQVGLTLSKNSTFFKLGERILKDIRTKLVEHVLKLQPSFFGNLSVGELLSRLENDVSVLQQVASSVFIELIANMINMVFVIAMMVYINWKLAILSGIIVAAYAVNYNYFGKKTRNENMEKLVTSSDMMGCMSEMFSNIVTLKLFNKEHWAFNKLSNHFEKLYSRNYNVKILQALNYNAAFALVVIGTGLLWLVGGKAVMDGTMTLGDIIAFATYQTMLFAPLRIFSGINNQMQSASAALERIYAILDEDPKIVDEPDAVTLKDTRGDIEFRNVTFSYDDNTKVLDGLSLKVNSGELVAFVGPSGCGKSTVFKLLSRLYDVQGGEIMVDGKNIKRYSIKSLRESIGVIPQEIGIFKMSIKENLTLGDSNISDEALQKIAASVDMEEYISFLDEGYDTQLEADGGNLSGGQKQRLGIARTFLRNNRILIIDEAMNSLDGERKKMVKILIKALRGKCTILIISHNMSEIENADKIFLIEGGTVSATGNHHELLEKNSTYKKLYGKEAV